jgi:hypothetical protein
MPEPIETNTAAESVEQPQPVPDVTSLAEHREAFPPAPKRGEVAPVEPDEQRPRHRAKSQTATGKDVEVIAEHTRRFREAEDKFIQEAGLKIEKQAGESERAFNVRRRAEIAEARLAAKEPEKKTEPVVAQPPVTRTVETSTFSEPEPKLEQFANAPDPYAAHLRALNAWDRRKEAHDSQQQTAQQSAATERERWVKQVQEDSSARFVAHIQANPSDKAIIEAEQAKPVDQQMILTPIMRVAIDTHRQGPQLMVELLKHPELADEIVLQTDGRYAFDSDGKMTAAVATLQRRLLARIQAVTTGAAVPPPKVIVAPRPPTPVRASATNAAESTRPVEPESRSLAEHRQKFGARR